MEIKCIFLDITCKYKSSSRLNHKITFLSFNQSFICLNICSVLNNW